MSNDEFVKKFDKMKKEAQDRWNNMTDEERDKMKSRSKRFARKSTFAIPSDNQSTSSK